MGGGGGGGGGMGDFGLVLQSAAAPGSRVKKGDVIAEFDRLNMLNRLDDFKASVEQQGESVNSLRTNLDVEKKAHQQSIENAKAALDKALLDLKTIPVQSDIQAEQLKLAAEEARARYKQLLNEVKPKEASQQAEYRIAQVLYEQAKNELQRIQVNTDRMLVKAPMDGLVVMGTTFRSSEMAQIQVGDQIFPGMMFMRVVDPSSMIVSAAVNQVDSEALRIGLRARVRFDAYPDLELPARVYSIAAMPSSQGARGDWVRQIRVVLKLDKLDPRVIPDLSVSADVVLETEPEAAIVPLETVFHENGQPFVFVRSASGWERRQVQLGTANNIVVAVRSGLRPGETVAAEWPPAQKRN